MNDGGGAVLVGPSDPSSELVAVLFTDIVGSTDLRRRHGEGSANEIFRVHRRLIRDRVERLGGHEVKSTGDGFLVTFRSPRAAVACAQEIQRALEERNRRFPGREAQVRIGLNAGEVTTEPGDVFGAAVDIAARVLDKADGGEILASNVVKELVSPAGEVEFRHRGNFRLKGFGGRWSLYEVPWEVAVPPGSRLRGPTPFVGRARERTELRAALDDAVRGEGRLVLIAGEPGAGKTRLATEIAAEARDRGALALIGRCHDVEGEGPAPFRPVVEMLEAVRRVTDPDVFREILGDEVSEIARVMPELRRLYPDVPPPIEMPPAQARRYVIGRIGDVLERAAGIVPMVLVLDDLHWADDSTLLVLCHVAERIDDLSALVLCTYREPEAAQRPSVSTALSEVVRRSSTRVLAVRSLDHDDVGAILGSLGGQDPPEDLVRVVYGETEGNPFFVEEVFRHLHEEGKLFDADGTFREGVGVAEGEVPRTVLLVLRRRLDRLAPEARGLLEAAAVLGREVSFDLLRGLPGMEQEALIDALEEAESAGIVGPVEDADGPTLAFPHELVRQSVLAGVGGARRARLHLAAAEAIEDAFPGSLDERSAELAHHLVSAGPIADRQKTAAYLVAAGERALEAAAFEDALRAFERAVEAAPADEGLRARLHYRLGLARRSLGRWEEAVGSWEEALEAYEGLGEVVAAGRLCAAISQQMAWGARWPDAVRVAMRGLEVLGDHEGPERSALLAVAGAVFSLAGDHEGGDRMTADALRLAEGSDVVGLHGGGLMSRVLHHLAFMRFREGAEDGHRAAAELRDAGRPWELADALGFTLIAESYLGNFEEARRLYDELEPLASRLGNVGALISARVWEGFDDLFVTGDVERWTRNAQRDLELRRTAGTPFVAIPHMFLGLGFFWGGEWERACGSLEEAARLEPPGAMGGTWIFLALCRAYSGDRDGALSVLSERGGVPRREGPLMLSEWAALLGAVELFWVLGDREGAAALYPRVLEAIGTGAVGRPFGDFRLLETLAGLAAASGGDVDGAGDHFRRALDVAGELPIRLEEPEARRFHAEVLLERRAAGDVERAVELLEGAEKGYRELGMKGHAALARERLRGL